MKTKAVRLYGKNDARLEEFELPPIKSDEIAAKIVSDSVCMSTYKGLLQGAEHKRIPKDIDKKPVILGHEFCGIVTEVGADCADSGFKPGDKFVMQTALNYHGSLEAIGYSYQYIGGDATNVIVPREALEMRCMIPYHGDAFYLGSLAEPMSCIIGGFHVNYHTRLGSYVHEMGIAEGGNMAILAGAGPMGLGMVDYAIHNPRRPKLLVVTDIDAARLERAAAVLTVSEAEKCGVKLRYVNTRDPATESEIMELTNGEGFSDIYVLAPVRAVVEQGVRLLGHDGCLNFFAGPTDKNFSAMFNFYNVHYAAAHIAGNTGGNTDDIREAIDMMGKGLLNPSEMITHVGGLDSVIETLKNLPAIPGGKKLIYSGINMPLTAIADFGKLGETDPVFAKLHEIVSRHNGLWNAEAEKYLLAHSTPSTQD